MRSVLGYLVYFLLSTAMMWALIYFEYIPTPYTTSPVAHFSEIICPSLFQRYSIIVAYVVSNNIDVLMVSKSAD